MKSMLPKGVSPSHLGNLPAPAKGALALMSGGGIMTVAWFATNGDRNAMLIVGLGLVVVVLLLGAYRALLGWFRKRRAAPLSQGLAGNAAAAPTGISEPARRARLDDLRRNFDQGVEKFRAAGKNMYSVPWYVLVGEPGSGKTEAIRHCNVGFPPGLQDQLQGAGGTLNMNWWFTNSAIILDTAGRLMFEEVVPGSTNEWNEFLALLKKNRPNCPINGMLLVIPVDTLIKDTAESIEKKAGKIAQQFEQIQRILGVRFPVFVIITKCDLLNGFREFFDDLNDPQLQHQIMGWSNPANLDERFDPSAVTNHLETVKQRLVDRRRQLLLDPVNTEDAQGRRTDQVDALYALPDALIKIAPRLRRYLEMIFVAGEWSPRPLFLRGIYFTSSMTEGSALDAELAEVLGVAVDSLPEGRVWRRDRAYFLRDLFIEKVFRERGLVTRASNADKQQRTRRAIVLTCGFLAVVALGVFTWFGARQLQNSIGKHAEFWADAADQDPSNIRIISKVGNNYHDTAFKVGKAGHDLDTAQMFGTHLALIQEPIKVPAIFRPMAVLSGDINGKRRDAYRDLYEATVLYPLFDATRKAIKTSTPETWNHDGVDALAQLMKAQYAAVNTGPAPAGQVHPYANLDPMFKYVLDDKERAKYQPDAETLQKVVDWIYSPEAKPGTDTWPPAAISPISGDSRAAIDTGVQNTINYWDRQTKGTGENIAAINRVKTALQAFRTADANMVAMKAHPVSSRDNYFTFAKDWQAQYAQVQKTKAEALDAWKAAVAATKASPDAASLRTLYIAEIDRVANAAEKDYDVLLRYTIDKQPSENDPSAKDLYTWHTQLTDAKAKFQDWQKSTDQKAILAEYTDIDANLLAMVKGVDDQQHHRFEAAAQVYDIANKFILQEGPPSDPTPLTGTLSDALNQADTDLRNADDVIDKINRQSNNPQDPLAQSCAAANFAADAGTRNIRWMRAMGALQNMPQTPDSWPQHIEEAAKKFPQDHLARPELPLVKADKYFSARFSPDAVGSVNEILVTAGKLVADPTHVLNAPDIATAAAAVKKPFDAYRDLYKTYWGVDVFSELKPEAKDWPDFMQHVSDIREKELRASLKAYGDRAALALTSANFSGDANDINLAIQKQDTITIQDEANSILSSWKNLSTDPAQARRGILSMAPSDFAQNYILGTTKDLDSSYVNRYWHRLAVTGLTVLARAGQADISNSLNQLKQYRRFPLAPEDAKVPDLSQQDVGAARTLLTKILGDVPAANNGSTPARTIAQGGTTRDKDVDTQLDLLRGTALLQGYTKYFDQLTKMLNALPPGQQTYTATLTVAKDKMKGQSSIADRYSYMQINLGADKLTQLQFANTNVVDSVGVTYPATGDLTFALSEILNGPVVQTETIQGPWSPLRLLKSDNVKSISRDGKKWVIEYIVTDAAKKTYPLWLTLEFKAEVPDLTDWPTPPAN